MDLYLHGQQEGCESTPALAENYVLHERYRLTAIISDNSFGITYLGVHIDSGALFRICECAPDRAANGIDVPKSAETKAAKRRFLNTAKNLSGCMIPHLPPLAEYFEENGTVYCVFPEQDTISLSQADIPKTPAYVRSLGIALCDTYAQLHRNGLFCGTISQSEIRLCTDGEFLLAPECIFDAAEDESMDRTADMHILTAFLLGFLMLFDEDAEQTAHPSLPILQNVLQYEYQNADLLKKALICEDGGTKEPKTFQSSVKPLIRAVLCLCCLTAAAAAAVYVGRNKLPLGMCMKLGLIQKDVISVWMPFREGADEKETQEMYSKLTEGFERKYEGYGVNLVIYADDSFGDALDFDAYTATPPTVFMDTQHETVQQLAADLSLLTGSLDDDYLADMDAFETALPLGCSVPALYYNAYSYEQMDVPTIAYSEIGTDVPYDESASAFVAYMEGDAVSHTKGDFSEFLQIRDERPILASTSLIADAERNAITSGAVRMLPVSANNSYPLQYEMYCSINSKADWNSQRIGMLWLQYLLTEEAQQIMFAEYYSALPLHSEVLPQTIENHDALSVIGDIQADFDSKALQ